MLLKKLIADVQKTEIHNYQKISTRCHSNQDTVLADFISSPQNIQTYNRAVFPAYVI